VRRFGGYALIAVAVVAAIVMIASRFKRTPTPVSR
jgi:hypothetical protein